VIAIVGDGGFLYNASELATAVRHNINVVTVVFNDGAYGNVSRDLDESWGGTYGAELHNPDFVKLADAYGAVGLRATSPTDVGDLVRHAVDLDRPVIIDVPVPRMPRDPSFARPRAPIRRPS
jgi:acetolactate synthase-1/2/3 large subunit